LDEIKGEIARKSKFKSQIQTKLNKVRIKKKKNIKSIKHLE
jgi:hypothetical protein